MKSIVSSIIAVFGLTINVYCQNCVNCVNAVNTGLNSTAVGYNAKSLGDFSLALGYQAEAQGLRSIAIGNQAVVSGGAGFALGNLAHASSINAFVLGTGHSSDVPLVNGISNSLGIGFNSNVPTLFVGPADGIGSYGNVGIGTSNPAQRLSVNGIVESTSGGFKFPDGTIQVTKANSTWQSGNNNNSIFYSGGNVGVGIQSPTATLDVYGDIVLGKPGDNFIIHSRSWIGDALVIAPQNNFGGWEWNKSLVLKDNGQVFIGGDLSYASPHTAYKLAVNGKTITREIIVTMQNWADTVFAPGYNLLKLSEIKQYIYENRHLPGVPAETEVLRQGISLGEMNKILMVKVEELTLYAINLQQQIDGLTKLYNSKVK